MEKEEGKSKVLMVMVVLLIFIVALHTFFNFYISNSQTSKTISGNSIISTTDEEGNKVSAKTRIIIASEWLLVIFVMLYILIKAKKRFQKEEKQSSSIKNVTLKKGKNKTDIDLLYELLLDKKSLQIAAIAKYFKVSKAIAMEWCQILEEGDLATVHYPTVGDPKIELYEEEKEDENEKKQNKDKK